MSEIKIENQATIHIITPFYFTDGPLINFTYELKLSFTLALRYITTDVVKAALYFNFTTP